jgi:hypothetical protein
MRSLLHRVGIVTTFGLVLFLASRLLRANGESRLAAAKTRVHNACRAFRAQPGQEDALVCRSDAYGLPAFESRNRARVKVNEANAALLRGEARVAETELTAAMKEVRYLNRRGTIGGVMAAEITEGVLDAIEAHRGTLDAHRILEGVELQVSTRPFESLAVHEMWCTSQYQETRLDDAPPMGAAELADAIDLEQKTYDEKARATIAGDTPACERAAGNLPRPSMGSQVGVRLCGQLATVVRVGKRLRAARA